MAFRALIVDDSSVIRSVIRRSLELSGLEFERIIEAADGAEALDRLDEEWVDVIFADLNMPGMSGMEMIERISSDDMLATIPTIVISSVRNRSLLDPVLARGVKAYISKPFFPEKLREVVGGVLQP